MNGKGATQPLIYFQRGTPPSPSPPSSPFSVAHIWTTPSGRKTGGVGERVSVRRRGEKNREMFSSGCNLSLSCLQHSRVILQHCPARRTEVALCLGLTQARIHLKPLLSLGCHSLRCRRRRHAAAAELRTVIYVFFQRILCSQFRHPEQ